MSTRSVKETIECVEKILKRYDRDDRPRRCVECAVAVMARDMEITQALMVAETGQDAADELWDAKKPDAWWTAEAAHLVLRAAIASRTDDPQFPQAIQAARDAVQGALSRSDHLEDPIRGLVIERPKEEMTGKTRSEVVKAKGLGWKDDRIARHFDLTILTVKSVRI